MRRVLRGTTTAVHFGVSNHLPNQPLCDNKSGVTLKHRGPGGLIAVLLGFLGVATAFGQIDPEKRELFQFGYNAPFEGHPPLSIYAY